MDNNFNNYNNGQQNGFGDQNNFGQTNNYNYGQTQQNGYGQTQQNNFGQTQNYGQTQQNGYGTTPGGAQRRYDPNSYATSSSQTTTTNSFNSGNPYAGMTPSDLRQQMGSGSFGSRANSFAANNMGEDNIVMGIVGGLIGALLGIVVWLIIARLGYISFIGGFAISAGAFYGYLLLGKGFSKTGIIVVAAIIIVSVWFAMKMSYAQALSRAFKELGVDYSVGECWKNMSDWMSLAGLKGRYYLDFVLGYLFTGAGALAVFKKNG